MQGITGHPIVSLQVDVTNDSDSLSRDVNPRLGSEGNCVGDFDYKDFLDDYVTSPYEDN